jgi:hypothetical protein
VDTPEKPKRPWWRRKRTWIAAALLACSYPLSFVPTCWVLTRMEPLSDDRQSWALLREMHRPTAAALKACPKPVQDAVRRAVDWGAPAGTTLSVRGTIGIKTELPADDPYRQTGQEWETLIVW